MHPMEFFFIPGRTWCLKQWEWNVTIQDKHSNSHMTLFFFWRLTHCAHILKEQLVLVTFKITTIEWSTHFATAPPQKSFTQLDYNTDL